jgi:hypothetical protein
LIANNLLKPITLVFHLKKINKQTLLPTVGSEYFKLRQSGNLKNNIKQSTATLKENDSELISQRTGKNLPASMP